MTQPTFVPITEADQVRPALRLSVPGAWVPQRPAEARNPRLVAGKGRGRPGPDQGFALKLARRVADGARLTEGESIDDAVLGCALIASRRAGTSGRAPSIHDVRLAFIIWGYLGEAPPALVAERAAAFRSLGHD